MTDPRPMPQMGNSIPDHLRASIMRLVQSQEEEEEEEARALREAHGEPIEEGEDDTRGIKVAEGEESENEEGDKVVVSFLEAQSWGKQVDDLFYRLGRQTMECIIQTNNLNWN